MVADPPCPMNDTLKLCAVVPEIIAARAALDRALRGHLRQAGGVAADG
jgi:hypothetical protein